MECCKPISCYTNGSSVDATLNKKIQAPRQSGPIRQEPDRSQLMASVGQGVCLASASCNDSQSPGMCSVIPGKGSSPKSGKLCLITADPVTLDPTNILLSVLKTSSDSTSLIGIHLALCKASNLTQASIGQFIPQLTFHQLQILWMVGQHWILI